MQRPSATENASSTASSTFRPTHHGGSSLMHRPWRISPEASQIETEVLGFVRADILHCSALQQADLARSALTGPRNCVFANALCRALMCCNLSERQHFRTTRLRTWSSICWVCIMCLLSMQAPCSLLPLCHVVAGLAAE